jgi:hypothetical protein
MHGFLQRQLVRKLHSIPMTTRVEGLRSRPWRRAAQGVDLHDAGAQFGGGVQDDDFDTSRGIAIL